MWSSGVEIDVRDVEIGKRIGAGGFAEVFKGRYRGTEVAVKRLLQKPGAAGDKALADFKAEVAMMTGLRHPNIVLFMGVCLKPLCLVTEFCSRGNLFDLLHNSKVKLDWPLKLRMALDAARGMNFLHTHTPVIIHRDLKSLNLLVDEKWCVKVSDFGLSRFKAPSKSSLMTAQCGTFHWMAPEVISGHRYTEKADVYSFGINLWELLTREVPYKGLQPMQVGVVVLTRGQRPPVPPGCPVKYAALMKACWHADPTKRPSFTQIIDCLAELISEHSASQKAAAMAAR
jgi:serine/threonine protein kinase